MSNFIIWLRNKYLVFAVPIILKIFYFYLGPDQAIFCGITSVRLVSSGKYRNKAGLMVRQADENDLVKSVEIEKVVRRLMQEYEGMELRKNAAKVREAAIKAVTPGGSSQTNIDTFVEHVRNLSHQRNSMTSAGSN